MAPMRGFLSEYLLTVHLEVSRDELVLAHGSWADVIATGQIEQEDQGQAGCHYNDSRSQRRLSDRLAWPAQGSHLRRSMTVCLLVTLITMPTLASGFDCIS